MTRIPFAIVRVLIAVGLIAPLPAVLLLRNLDLYGTWKPIPLTVYVLFLGWYTCFFAGYFLIRPVRMRSIRQMPNPNLWVPVLSLIAVVGAALLTYNFVVVRGYGFGTPVYLLRMRQVLDAEAGYVGSWIGGFGRLFMPAIIVAWLTATISWRRLRLPALTTLVCASLLVFVYQALYEGGRFFIVALILAALFGTFLWVLSDSGRDRVVDLRAFRLLHMVPLTISLSMALGASIYSSYVFAERGEHVMERIDRLPPEEITELIFKPDGKVPSAYALSYLNYAAIMDIDFSSFLDIETFDSRDYVRAMAWNYLTQGLGEFARLHRSEQLEHAGGLYQFPQAGQLLSLILGGDFRYKIPKGMPDGTYISLPGAFYLDFGPMISFALAFGLGVVFRRGVDGAILGTGSVWTLTAPIIFVVVIAAPISSLIISLWPTAIWIALTVLKSNSQQATDN